MASIVRAMLLLAIPAAGVGAVAGLWLGESRDDAVEPAPTPRDPAAVLPVDDAVAAGKGRPLRHAVRPPRARSGDPPAGGDGRAPSLDPSIGRRLADPDESVRHACALELMRMGTSVLDEVDRLSPATEEGRRLRDAIVNSLDALRRNERSESWGTRPEEAREQLRLKYLLAVVPESAVREERRRYWQMRVDGDPARLANAAITEGQAAWSRLELARARFELGEIDDAAWVREREASLPVFRTWVAESASRGEMSPARREEARAAVERLGR